MFFRDQYRPIPRLNHHHVVWTMVGYTEHAQVDEARVGVCVRKSPYLFLPLCAESTSFTHKFPWFFAAPVVGRDGANLRQLSSHKHGKGAPH
jgi:hypothetical protein